jgi:hypothetical protein
MKKHFYTHLVETESLVVKLHEMGMTEEQKIQLITLVESSMHHAILDAILSELSEQDKKLFLKEMANDDHDSVWKFLNKKIDSIEDKIVQAADALKEELHEDIKEVKSK